MAFVAGVYLLDAQERPVGSIGIAALVAYPPTTGTAITEDHRLRLQFANELPRARVIIIGAAIYLTCLFGTAIPTIATVGTVEPHLVHLAILCEQFLQLGIEIFHVERCTIERLVAVPRREVQSQFQPILLASCRQLAYHITLAVLVGCVTNTVVGILCWPKTEAIVMLGSEDDALHASLFAHACPLLTVEACGVERLQRCIAIAPFAVAEGVRTEVDECIGFQLLPSYLIGRRQWGDGGWCILCIDTGGQQSRAKHGE